MLACRSDGCKECGKCCTFIKEKKSFVPEITDEAVLDYARWLGSHAGVSVELLESHVIEVKQIARCKYLDKGRCIRYGARFDICKDYLCAEARARAAAAQKKG